MSLQQLSASIEDYTKIKSLFKNERVEIIKAKRNADDQPVVLKQTLLLKDNISHATRLAHEYEILKDLNHPGIPKGLDILYDGKTVSLVQEFADGMDLKSHILNKPFSFSQVLDIAIQLADILHYIHQNGIAHKDINSGNILLTKDGTLKLLDFGISSNLYSESNEILNLDEIEGTLTYISPEQTGHTAYSVTQSCDFYSSGILMYELLTGKPPFDSVDPLELIHFHLSRKPIPLKTIIPNLPGGLEKVVAKLIEKKPDDRYQSALGFKADLTKIKEHYIAKKPLENFIAGENDITERYKQSQKLYGRENEINELLDYYKNLNRLHSMLVLVAGYSGVGKSALIRHIKFPIIQKKGTFLNGKFDQFKKDIPYYGFIEAIREFIKNLLAEPEEKIVYWSDRILDALGENAGLIVEVIPQLSKIIGEQPEVPTLQPAEQEARFHMVLIDFIYVFSTQESPLVIFLDDLQWADLPSLRLVLQILQNPKEDNILILGAYRNNEVEKGHPLLITLKQIREFKGQVKEIELQPLNLQTTAQITADSFGMNKLQANKLGQHIFAKTKGNPFFIHSFLKSLYDKKLVIRSPENEWIWDNNEIDNLNYTDNVIDLMTNGLSDLPIQTQLALKYSAVLGNTFTLKDLADITKNPQTKVLLNLAPAIKGAYIKSANLRNNEMALSLISKDFDTDNKLSERNISFTFSHDKVQQAAYNLEIGEGLKQLHLKIGRLLLESRDEKQIHEDIFELVNHFGISYQLLSDSKEKEEVAELCLSAGKKAKDSTSYNLAVSFLNIAKNLLPKNSWKENYNLTYNVLLTLGECEYLNDNPDNAEKYFKKVLKAAKTRFEKLQVYYLHSSLYLKIGNTLESLRIGMEAARLYNIRFPKNKVIIQIAALFAMMKYLFLFSTKFRNPEKLYNQKDCVDEERVALHKFLIDLATSAYMQDQNLMMLVIFKLVKLYIKDGFTDASGFGFSGFSVVVLSALKMQKRGFALWNITKRMHMKTHSPLIKWRLSYTVHAYENHRNKPFSESYADITEMIKACRLNGDQIFTAYSVALNLRIKFFAGTNLKALIKNSDDHIPMIRNNQVGLDFMLAYYQLTKILNSKSIGQNWEEEIFNQTETLARMKEENNRTKFALYHTPKSVAHYFLGQFHESLIESEKAAIYFDNILGDVDQIVHTFFTALNIAAVFKDLDKTEQKKWLKIFKGHLKTMQLYAKGCAENFSSHLHLLKAELDAINKNTQQAFLNYEKAIKLSIQNKISYVEAIAYERAGELCKTGNLHIHQSVYINQAWKAYKKWGAEIKCSQLEADYRDFFKLETLTETQDLNTPRTETSMSSKTALDLASVLKASQTIASQVKYEDLLKNLLHITIENAGAERSCLLLYKSGRLCVEAIGISGKNEIEIIPSIPFEETDLIPKTVINYCKRTGESLVIDEANQEDRFKNDSYIQKNQILSLVCVPITAIGNIKGLLYLENNLLKGVFNKDRIELLQMLSGQIGISIENSILYENLEEKVKERTIEIENTLVELKATQAQLIQSEKMASLGELTAGIAHEIQNPLNFVNNFSEVSKELLEELHEELEKGDIDEVKHIYADVKENLEKINNHGKRAEAIVKGMLQHSRTNSGIKEPTNINALCDEYLRLSYHGLLAKDKSFKASYKTDFDESLPKINVIPQDMGRVLLNLINNAFYAVDKKAGEVEKDFQPEVIVKSSMDKKSAFISVKDNGSGIAEENRKKIFQPFFTTKPTGKGTGLGLSLSYDIIKALGGNILVNSKEGEGSEFIIQIPLNELKTNK